MIIQMKIGYKISFIYIKRKEPIVHCMYSDLFRAHLLRYPRSGVLCSATPFPVPKASMSDYSCLIIFGSLLRSFSRPVDGESPT